MVIAGIKCTGCGSDDVVKAGFNYRSIGKNPKPQQYYKDVRVQRYVCKRCGKTFIIKVADNDTGK